MLTKDDIKILCYDVIYDYVKNFQNDNLNNDEIAAFVKGVTEVERQLVIQNYVRLNTKKTEG